MGRVFYLVLCELAKRLQISMSRVDCGVLRDWVVEEKALYASVEHTHAEPRS